MNSIGFLTTVARSVHHQLFRNEDALRQVLEEVSSMHILCHHTICKVLDNLFAREEDSNRHRHVCCSTPAGMCI